MLRTTLRTPTLAQTKLAMVETAVEGAGVTGGTTEVTTGPFQEVVETSTPRMPAQVIVATL